MRQSIKVVRILRLIAAFLLPSTCRLHIPPDLVLPVCAAAVRLKMYRVASECARFLSSNINLDNCLELRSMAAIMSRMPDLADRVDDFVSEHIDVIRESRAFFALPRIDVEVKIFQCVAILKYVHRFLAHQNNLASSFAIKGLEEHLRMGLHLKNEIFTQFCQPLFSASGWQQVITRFLSPKSRGNQCDNKT